MIRKFFPSSGLKIIRFFFSEMHCSDVDWNFFFHPIILCLVDNVELSRLYILKNAPVSFFLPVFKMSLMRKWCFPRINSMRILFFLWNNPIVFILLIPQPNEPFMEFWVGILSRSSSFEPCKRVIYTQSPLYKGKGQDIPKILFHASLKIESIWWALFFKSHKL